MTDTILFNGRIATLDPGKPAPSAVAIRDGLFASVGDDREIMARREANTAAIDLNGRTVLPGLNDSHTHVLTIVGGRVEHGDQEFKNLAPPLPPAMPDGSPVRIYGGYQRPANSHASACRVHGHDYPRSDPRANGRCGAFLAGSRLRMLCVLTVGRVKCRR